MHYKLWVIIRQQQNQKAVIINIDSEKTGLFNPVDS